LLEFQWEVDIKSHNITTNEQKYQLSIVNHYSYLDITIQVLLIFDKLSQG